MGALATSNRTRRAGTALLVLGLVVGAVGVFGVGTSMAAAGLDFAAAEPGTYDHLDPPDNAVPGTFGYGNGSKAYVVEQLEGGDYDCDQIVPFFTKLDLGDETSVDLQFTFDRFTTGHKDGEPGVGYRDVVGVWPSTSDTVHDATGATLSWGKSNDADHTYATATVGGLGDDEVYILRVDVKIGCDVGADPKDNTGNLLAHLDADLPGGAQTVPMKSAANLLVGPRGASLVVVKDAVPDDPRNFTFHLSTTETAFILDDADPDDGDAYVDRTEPFILEPGNYTITESASAGWTFTGARCDDDPATSSTVPSISVTLAAGDRVTCTFTNTKDTPSGGGGGGGGGTTTLPPSTTTTTTAPPTTIALIEPLVVTPEAPTTTVAVAVLGVQLARTGDPTLVLGAFAALLLSAGGALVVSGQRRPAP